MADFDDILVEQKKTNELLKKQKKPLDEQASSENELIASAEAQIDKQSETTEAIHDLHVAIVGGKDDQNKLHEDTPSTPKSTIEETTKETNTAANKRFGKLGDIFKKQIGGLTKVFGKLGTGVKTGLAAGAWAIGFFALAKFLESETWKKIREWIIKHGAATLDKIWTTMKKIWNDYLLPFSKWLGGKILNFLDDLITFIDKPTWDNFAKLVGDNKLVITGLAAMFLPTGTMMVALLAFKAGWTGIAGAIGKGTKVLTGLGALLGGGAGVGAVLAAGAVTATVALARAKKAFDMERNEYEKKWYEALATAAAVFYIELFKIPAETLAMFIPQTWKDKFFMHFVDQIENFIEDLSKTLDLKVFPFLTSDGRIKLASWNDFAAAFEVTVNDITSAWDGILDSLKWGQEQLARKLLGIKDEPPPQIELTEDDENRLKDYDPTQGEEGMDAMALQAGVDLAKDVQEEFGAGINVADLFGSQAKDLYKINVLERTKAGKKLDEEEKQYQLRIQENEKKLADFMSTNPFASEASFKKAWDLVLKRDTDDRYHSMPSVNLQNTNNRMGDKYVNVNNTNLVDMDMSKFQMHINNTGIGR